MPRELYLVTPLPVTLPAIIVAGASIDEKLGVRTLNHGVAIQLVNHDDIAVVTIENSRQLVAGTDAARVVPGISQAHGHLWWTDATAPWGTVGAVGVAIAQQIALNLGGTFIAEDGT